MERPIANAGHAGRNGDVCQRGTAAERVVSYATNRISSYGAWNRNIISTPTITCNRGSPVRDSISVIARGVTIGHQFSRNGNIHESGILCGILFIR